LSDRHKAEKQDGAHLHLKQAAQVKLRSDLGWRLRDRAAF